MVGPASTRINRINQSSAQMHIPHMHQASSIKQHQSPSIDPSISHQNLIAFDDLIFE
jgi:hypothetical protein